MGRLAVIAGSSLRGTELPEGDWELTQRHGKSAAYVLPHRIDHVANMRALLDAGCDRVLALSSVGGLRAELVPGTVVCPDDFIALSAAPVTALDTEGAHRVAGFDQAWRAEVLEAVRAEGGAVQDGGVYWHAAGPRLETPAEIRYIAPHADVIGMTLGVEAVIAGELGLRYAALCVVDNLASGVSSEPLTLEQIDANRVRMRERLISLIAALLPRLA